MIAPLLLALSLPPSRAGLVTQARRIYANCAGRLTPFGRHNAAEAVTLRTGERVPQRQAVEIVRLAIEVALKKKDGLPAIESFVRLAHDPTHVVGPEHARLLRRHGLLRVNGRVPEEIVKVVRAIGRIEGERVFIVAPVALPILNDAELRAYLERVDDHVVAGLIRLAKARGLDVVASTSPPVLDGPRTPRDGTLLVDLGAEHAPITLITPFGRLEVASASGLGDQSAWDAFKLDARLHLHAIPVDLGEASSPTIFAALSDLGDDRFKLPDEGLDRTTPARATFVESWNALKAPGRGPSDQEP